MGLKQASSSLFELEFLKLRNNGYFFQAIVIKFGKCFNLSFSTKLAAVLADSRKNCCTKLVKFIAKYLMNIAFE